VTPSALGGNNAIAAAISLRLGTIAIAIWSRGPSATPRRQWRRDPGRGDTRTRPHHGRLARRASGCGRGRLDHMFLL